MLTDLLVWLGVVAAAFVAWSLYASSGSPSAADDQDTPSIDD